MNADAMAPLREDDVLAVRELSVVSDGGQYIVGDPARQTYVVLPEVGVRVIELLRGGATIGQASTAARAVAGEEVDVADFARSLTELGFANLIGNEPAPEHVRQAPPRWLRRASGPTACAAYAACALAVAALLALDPALFPRPRDVFFLDTPVRSIAALTLMTYLFAAAHEGAHWLAARAVGVAAKITISRRLYFLALEIDLSGLWSLPRRRRYAALRVNELLVRRTLRRITPAQRVELAGAPPRDLAVARWYRWIHLLGIGGAAWFFVALFAPATIRLLTWIGENMATGDPSSTAFWEALAFGLLILSPRVFTLRVALRDLKTWRARRALAR